MPNLFFVVVRTGDRDRRWRRGEGVRPTTRRAYRGDRAEGGAVSHLPRSGGMPSFFFVWLFVFLFSCKNG